MPPSSGTPGHAEWQRAVELLQRLEGSFLEPNATRADLEDAYLGLPSPRDPNTLSEGTWTILDPAKNLSYITVSPITVPEKKV